MRRFLVILCCLWPEIGLAQGFTVHDLTILAEEGRTALGEGTTAQAQPFQLVLTCATCDSAPTAEMRLGRLTDGTEGRVRSGKTTLAALEALCVKRNPDCRLTSLPAGPAIGWISVYALGRGAGATAVVLRDGDLLTIDARAASRGAAEDAVQRIAQRLLPRIVGR